ncbi:MAG: AAA family ATPase [Desulfobacteraceae bacterium]|nr:AAA family ATPase [Desulfobacteraceae bacterium]MBC2718107.1 AAA family ATPase [Desulfobacteraceae bacterium]
MIKSINITGFKCISQACLDFQKLTLLTGPNASGKSSVIQALLLVCSAFDQKNQTYLKETVKPFAQFEDVYCRFTNAQEVNLALHFAGTEHLVTLNAGGLTATPTEANDLPGYEESLFYLAANRIGPEEISQLNKELCIGQSGQFAFGLLEQRKNKPVHPAIVHSGAAAKTLKAQLTWWLSFVIGTETEVRTEKVTSTTVKTTFNADGMEEITPLNTGAGNSYVLKLLIMCLIAKPGDMLLIENPEIHLHPGAQSRLGSLLAFLAAVGVQLVVETHCEHLINRVRYEIYKKKFLAKDVVVYYKPTVEAPFEKILLNSSGHFCNNQQKEIAFPSGFFDSTLAELLEIG